MSKPFAPDWLPPVLFAGGIVSLAIWTIVKAEADTGSELRPDEQGTTLPPGAKVTTENTTLPPVTVVAPAPPASGSSGRIGTTDFYWKETAISGSYPSLAVAVPNQYRSNVERLAQVVQPWRKYVGKPFNVTSWYRSPTLNTRVGGSPTSQHLTASALDFNVGSQTRGVFVLLLNRTVTIPCGQVIWYPRLGFIHVALPSTRYPNPTFFVSPSSKVYRQVTSLVQLSDMGY